MTSHELEGEGTTMGGDPARDLRDLIDELSGDLEPVRPIAPLSLTLAWMLVVAAAVAVLVFVSYGARPGLVADFPRDAAYTGAFAGLLAAVLGGCVAALASVVPGRERVLHVGAGLAVAGLVLGVGVAVGSIPWGEAVLAGPLTEHLACIARGIGFAVIPAAVALWLAARGWSARPGLTVALALLSAGALGALLVHMTCPALDPLHTLYTHMSTPVLVMLLLTAALMPAMRRWAR